MEYQDGWTLADAKAKYSDLLQSHHSLCWTVEILKDEKAKLLLQLGEAQDILASMLIAGEIDVHGEDPKCPQDDTCACPWAKKINAAMKGYAEEWKHSGPGLSPITEKPKCDCGADALPVPAHRAGCAARSGVFDDMRPINLPSPGAIPFIEKRKCEHDWELVKSHGPWPESNRCKKCGVSE